MQKITPFLWFDNQAEEAANFYVSVFKNSSIESVSRYSEAGPGTPGSAMTVNFKLEGQDFVALNGGPIFQFTPAISLYVDCATQEEVDHLWNQLSAVPEAEQCGWLQDKFGVSWQIVPSVLGKLMQDEDPAKAKRVVEAMLQMKKLDIAALQAAYDQGGSLKAPLQHRQQAARVEDRLHRRRQPRRGEALPADDDAIAVDLNRITRFHQLLHTPQHNRAHALIDAVAEVQPAERPGDDRRRRPTT